jgi:hypothetical protein
VPINCHIFYSLKPAFLCKIRPKKGATHEKNTFSGIIIVIFNRSFMGTTDKTASLFPEIRLRISYGRRGRRRRFRTDIQQAQGESLRIKEQFTRCLIMNLYFIFYLKDYTEQTTSNYHYFILNPDLSVKFTEKLKWYMAFKTKWVLYDEPDTQGLSKDYNSFSFKTNLTYRPITQLSFIPSFQGIYDVYENKDKSKQTYNFGLSILSKIKSFILGAKYKGIIRLDLGGESTVTTRFNNEFGVSLTFDPNRLRD